MSNILFYRVTALQKQTIFIRTMLYICLKFQVYNFSKIDIESMLFFQVLHSAKVTTASRLAWMSFLTQTGLEPAVTRLWHLTTELLQWVP